MEGTEGLGNKHYGQSEPESLEPILAIRDSTAFPDLAPFGWIFYCALHVPCPLDFTKSELHLVKCSPPFTLST